MESIIGTVRNELIRSISGLDAWFDKDDTLMEHKLSSGEWCVRELLEHVMLTNRFLLNFIDQGSAKVISEANTDFSNFIQEYCLEDEALADAGIHQSIDWTRYSHMQPTGQVSLPDVRREIREQLDRCLIHLELLSHGEGILYKTNMEVEGVGKLDVYQNIYFLAAYVKRHLNQLSSMNNEQ